MKLLVNNPFFPSEKKQTAGFTLMEVIVVVAIIGIMAAIAIPAISSWVPNYRLKGEARLVYSHLQRAKSEAVKRNVTVTMNFPQNCQEREYTFELPDETVFFQHILSDGICLEAGEEGAPESFSGRGLNPEEEVRTIRVGHVRSNRTYTITQTVAGGIRLE